MMGNKRAAKRKNYHHGALYAKQMRREKDGVLYSPRNRVYSG